MENKVIGVFAVCNTAGICVHEIDHAEDRVLASMNGIDPEWYPITEKPQSEMGGDSDEMESGFEFGSFFVRGPGSLLCGEVTRRPVAPFV